MASSTSSSPAPGVIPDTIAGPVSDGPRVIADADRPATQASAGTANGGETPAARFRRKVHRTQLHGYAIATVALVAYLIALAASNTARVKVNWVFGSSHVSLVWLVLFASILAWLLGLMVAARLRWRTRAPHRGGPTS